MEKCISKKSKAKIVICQIHKVMNQYFPDLAEKLENKVDDPRKRKEYCLNELLLGCIFMFLFKEGSRNSYNNLIREGKFRKNMKKTFGIELPMMDAVDDVLRLLDDGQLELIKAGMIQGLVKSKVLEKHKFAGKYLVVVDGTGVYTYDHQHCPRCLKKTSKTGKTTWFHNVLEAKLVTSLGLSLSLASEWIENPEGDFDKQDCELKAFERLSRKIKKLYPRLPICILADGLYPNQNFFKRCQQYQWDYIVTLQDGNLKSIQEEIMLLPDTAKKQCECYLANGKKKMLHQRYTWINDVVYIDYKLHWIECIEGLTGDKKKKQFVFITSIFIDTQNAINIANAGRNRWKIENQGFNIQKNNGYNLEHKYSRVSYRASKNYYQCMQIAHIINQLVEHTNVLVKLLKAHSKETIVHLWKTMKSALIYLDFNDQPMHEHIKKRYQVRLA